MSTISEFVELTSIQLADPESAIDQYAVGVIASKMIEKLNKKRAQGRGKWWHEEYCTQQTLSTMLREHVEKGDPLDVAIFAMMLYLRDESII